MIKAQNFAFGTFLVPAQYATGNANSAIVDTLGYDYMTVLVSIGVNAGAFTRLRLEWAEDAAIAVDPANNGDFDPAAVPLLDIAGNATALPDATDNVNYTFEVDLRDKPRYVRINHNTGGNTMMSALAILTRAEIKDPDTALARGLAAPGQVLRV